MSSCSFLLISSSSSVTDLTILCVHTARSVVGRRENGNMGCKVLIIEETHFQELFCMRKYFCSIILYFLFQCYLPKLSFGFHTCSCSQWTEELQDQLWHFDTYRRTGLDHLTYLKLVTENRAFYSKKKIVTL